MPRFYSNGYNLEICPRPSSRVSRPPTGSLHLGNARTAFSATCGRERAAGDSFCASRTRMSSAARRATATRSSRTCAGWDSIGTRDRMSEVRSAPYLQSERGAWYRELFAPGVRGRAYPCYCTAEELELSRKLQRMAGKPPRYAGTCRALTPAERAARRARTASRRCVSPCPGDGDRVHRSRARTAEILPRPTSAISSSAARTARRVLFLQRRRRFRRWASPTSCAATIISPIRRAS
jgi:hypothetical protein